MVLASGHATVWGCAHCRCFLWSWLGSRHSAGSLLLTSGCGERGQKRKEQVTECPSPYLCLTLFTLWLSVCSPGNSYKKKQQKSHPKLPGVRWSSNWRSVQKDLWTRASSEQTFPICFFLFFAPKSTLQLCPRQALGPKTVKCQKMEKKKKKKKIALTDYDQQGTCISR